MSKQKSRLRPLHDMLVVQREKAQDRTEGGLYLPEQGREKPKRGEVLAVGPGRKGEDGARVAMDVQVGDVVLFTGYAGYEQPDMGDGIIVIREQDVLGVLE